MTDYTNEIIIPEWYIVKREILDRFFEILDLTTEMIKKPHPKRLGELRSLLFTFYITIRTKVPQNNEKVNLILNRLEPLEICIKKAIPYNVELKEVIKHFTALQELLDEIGLTKILLEKDDPNFAFR